MEAAQALAYCVATMQADSACAAAATGGIWHGFAPLGTIGPYILVTHQGGMDTTTANGARLFSDLVFQLKAVGPASSYAVLVAIADRIDALFKRTGPTATSSTSGVLSCIREQQITYSELVNGAQIDHLGGLYRLKFQQS